MKNSFTLLLAALLLAGPVHAQTTDPVRQKLDLIFANIDKNQVPTGRLAEAAVPLAPLSLRVQDNDDINLPAEPLPAETLGYDPLAPANPQA